MDNQHKKIRGYRDLTQVEIDLMNESKALEARFNSFIDKLKADPGTDKRDVALAQTEGENAFIRAVRSIARPERLTA